MSHARDAPASARESPDASNPARLRWAVNVERWRPEGDHEGAEFAFLLTLLPPHEREDCLKMRFMPDKKRALVSRLMQRAACSRVASLPHDDVVIHRTKGRKPFLARAPNRPPLPHAPNFNFNVSHEGDFVVLASEPHAICGVDVAAPGQARRRDRNGRLPSAEEMLSTFGDVLAPAELAAIRAQPDDDAMEEAFRRHWSLKEALAKAMGVGLALDLGRADFAVVPSDASEVDESSPGAERSRTRATVPSTSATSAPSAPFAHSATLTLDGTPKTRWRFHTQPLGERATGEGGGRHWVTVSRGPAEDVVDAVGEFTATWGRTSYDEREWNAVLDAPHPNFVLMTVGDLVPEESRDAYQAAGGEVY